MKRLCYAVVVLLALTLTVSASELSDAYEVVIEQEQIIKDQKLEITKLEEREKARYLIRVPFTKIGITKDHGTGFIAGGLTVLILL